MSDLNGVSHVLHRLSKRLHRGSWGTAAPGIEPGTSRVSSGIGSACSTTQASEAALLQGASWVELCSVQLGSASRVTTRSPRSPRLRR